jgi:hypothetical protein
MSERMQWNKQVLLRRGTRATVIGDVETFTTVAAVAHVLGSRVKFGQTVNLARQLQCVGITGDSKENTTVCRTKESRHSGYAVL